MHDEVQAALEDFEEALAEGRPAEALALLQSYENLCYAAEKHLVHFSNIFSHFLQSLPQRCGFLFE